ncbi:MAG: hypothetical protein FK730_12020 [Asgard group archaeon]|nr:hypothetical protein [Asgard group archaeon]
MKGLFIFRKLDFKLYLLILIIFTNVISLTNNLKIDSIQIDYDNPNISINQSIINLPQFKDNLLGTVSTLREGMIIEGTSLANDTENNCFFAGTVNYDFGTEFDVLIGKLNSTNTIEWVKIISYNLIDNANDVVLDINQQKGYILGETAVSWNEDSNCLISCFNLTSGNILWNLTFGDSLLSEEGLSLVLVDEFLYISGIQTETIQMYDTPDIFLACVNSSDQTLLWMNSDFNSFYDCSPSLLYAEEIDELFLVYNRYEKTRENYQFILQKSDLDGNITWIFSSNSSRYPKINDFMLLNSEQLLLAGDCYEDTSTSYRDNYIAYYNLSNELINEKTYGKQLRNEEIRSVDFSEYHDIMICGFLESDINNKDVAFISNIELDGTLIWSRESYAFYVSQLNDLIILPDKRIITLGLAAYEFDFFYRRLLVCGTLDNDRDSLSDYWEPTIGTDPNKADTDGDGFSDAEEYFASTDPLNPRSFPARRISLRSIGLSIFLVLSIGFIIIQLFLSFTNDEKTKKKSITIKLIEFFKKFRKKSKD